MTYPLADFFLDLKCFAWEALNLILESKVQEFQVFIQNWNCILFMMVIFDAEENNLKFEVTNFKIKEVTPSTPIHAFKN